MFPKYALFVYLILIISSSNMKSILVYFVPCDLRNRGFVLSISDNIKRMYTKKFNIRIPISFRVIKISVIAISFVCK